MLPAHVNIWGGFITTFQYRFASSTPFHQLTFIDFFLNNHFNRTENYRLYFCEINEKTLFVWPELGEYLIPLYKWM